MDNVLKASLARERFIALLYIGTAMADNAAITKTTTNSSVSVKPRFKNFLGMWGVFLSIVQSLFGTTPGKPLAEPGVVFIYTSFRVPPYIY